MRFPSTQARKLLTKTLMAVQDRPSHSLRVTFSLPTACSLLSGVVALLTLTGCSTVPKGLETARNFDPLRFEGTWHEIARTNHPDEAGLTRVSTNFKRTPDGNWLLTDRAWSNAEGTWVGGARTAKSGDVPGSFKVRHSKPRYVAMIDSEHTMAVVCSSTINQFWLLSKNPEPDSSRTERMLGLAQEAGFPVKEAFFVPTR